MDSNDVLKLSNQLCFPLYSASREVIKKYTPYLKDVGLTYTQYITMMVMWEENEINITSLGRKLFLDSGTLTPVLKNLEKQKYITRIRQKDDERIVRVKLTDEGIRLKEKVKEIPLKVGSCINLSKEDATSLYKILYKILNN